MSKNNQIDNITLTELTNRFRDAMNEIIGPGQNADIAFTLARIAFGLPCKVVLYEVNGCIESVVSELPLDLLRIDPDRESCDSTNFVYPGNADDGTVDTQFFSERYEYDYNQVNTDFVRNCFWLFEQAQSK